GGGGGALRDGPHGPRAEGAALPGELTTVTSHRQWIGMWMRRGARLLALGLPVLVFTGCQHKGAITGWLEDKRISLNGAIERVNPFVPPPPPSGPADSLVIRGDRIEPEAPPPESMGDYTLAGAYELYRQGKYE